MSKVTIVVLVCIILLSSCVSTHDYGTDFNMDDVYKIQKGITTKEQILRTFGTPHETEIKKGNIETLSYTYVKKDAEIFSFSERSKMHTKALVIVIQNGIVVDFDHLETFKNRE